MIKILTALLLLACPLLQPVVSAECPSPQEAHAISVVATTVITGQVTGVTTNLSGHVTSMTVSGTDENGDDFDETVKVAPDANTTEAVMNARFDTDATHTYDINLKSQTSGGYKWKLRGSPTLN